MGKFETIELGVAEEKYNLSSFGNIGELSRTPDSYLEIIVHKGNLTLENDLNQEFIEEQLEDELSQYTLVIIDGDLVVDEKIDICDDNTYTHLVVIGNVKAKKMYCNSWIYITGNLELNTLHEERENYLVVKGNLAAIEKTKDY
jgi:predicted acyltransferase (DUF342 family)